MGAVVGPTAAAAMVVVPSPSPRILTFTSSSPTQPSAACSAFSSGTMQRLVWRAAACGTGTRGGGAWSSASSGSGSRRAFIRLCARGLRGLLRCGMSTSSRTCTRRPRSFNYLLACSCAPLLASVHRGRPRLLGTGGRSGRGGALPMHAVTQSTPDPDWLIHFSF